MVEIGDHTVYTFGGRIARHVETIRYVIVYLSHIRYAAIVFYQLEIHPGAEKISLGLDGCGYIRCQTVFIDIREQDIDLPDPLPRRVGRRKIVGLAFLGQVALQDADVRTAVALIADIMPVGRYRANTGIAVVHGHAILVQI